MGSYNDVYSLIMEHNVFSKAVDSAHQSFDSVSSWFNTLSDFLRDTIKLKENRSQIGNVLFQQGLGMEKRTSVSACTLYHVDTTNSNTVFHNSQKSFRGNNFKTGSTHCMSCPLPSSHAITKDETIRMDQMYSSTNSEVDLMNGHPVKLLKKDSLPNICTLISTASDNGINVTDDYNRINTGSSRIAVMNGKDTQSNRNKICQGYEHIRDFRIVTSCNNESNLTVGRPNYLSVSNPALLSTNDSTDQRLSAYNDLRKTDSNDNKRIVLSKGYHTNSNSRRVSICSDTKVNTWNTVCKDNAVEAYSDNYAVYIEHVLKSHTAREKHIIPKEVPKQSLTGRLKVCVQHFETTKTLRVIVLTASNLNVKRGHIYPRLTVHYGIAKTKSKTVKLPKEKANTLVVFNTAGFFENIDEEKIEELILKVRLYHKKGVFKFKKCLGELVIPVYKYNLSMDTNIKGRLKHKNLQNISDIFDDYGDDDEDIEVLSDDKSISAIVVEAVNPGSRYTSPGNHRRGNSLPTHMRHGTRYNAN